jgi:DNA-directed RNA polymerase specialized sigma24 family protein
MNESSIDSMNEQDRQISEIIGAERSRLRNFIGRRVPDPAGAEDILQEVFYKLVEANRLLMPIDAGFEPECVNLGPLNIVVR